jgi:hypothetical protein
MEIHAPEGPVRSVKDFLVHLSMITLGIVIALSLEGALEHRAGGGRAGEPVNRQRASAAAADRTAD